MCDIVASGPHIGSPCDIIYAPKNIELHIEGQATNFTINLVRAAVEAFCTGVNDDLLRSGIGEKLSPLPPLKLSLKYWLRGPSAGVACITEVGAITS